MTASSSDFTANTKWEDWQPTFINFLRTNTECDGVHLDYICRTNNEPDRTPQVDILNKYVLQTPLTGDAFRKDAAEAHTYITKCISGNSTAESKILSNTAQNNGRLDCISLKNHYEGIGVNSVDILKAEHTLESLFYSGETKIYM